MTTELILIPFVLAALVAVLIRWKRYATCHFSSWALDRILNQMMKGSRGPRDLIAVRPLHQMSLVQKMGVDSKVFFDPIQKTAISSLRISMPKSKKLLFLSTYSTSLSANFKAKYKSPRWDLWPSNLATVQILVLAREYEK